MAQITLPNGWRPRKYQRNLWNYMENGGKRAIAIWHRRAGKDDVAMHWTAVAAHQRTGTYWHMLPEAAQARKAIWESINPHTGKRRIDEAFPPQLREITRENEMFLRLKCQSTWQLVGSDNYTSLLGSPPIGVVSSEYSTADPNAWGYVRPILAENNGWAMFITTPRGNNHAYHMYKAALEDKNWFAELLTADDTSVFDPEALAVERAEMFAEYGDHGRFEQEYYCSFLANQLGAIYAKLMDDAERDGRITNVPHEPRLPVHCAMDIGIGDAWAMFWVQLVAKEIRIIRYYESSGHDISHYVREMDKYPYKYGDIIVPHDAEARELGTGKSRVEVMESLGVRNIRVIPQQRIEDGINAVRVMMPQMWFDKTLCARGIDCLRNYTRQWDEKRKTFLDRPYHNWASNGSDALRYFCLSGVKNAGAPQKITYPDYGFV